MEHGSSPTNYPGRTPIQIVGRLLFSVIILAAGRTRTSKGMRFWSDQLPHSATINLGLCEDVRSTPPFLPPAISDRKIRFPGNREPWFWRCRRNEGGHSQIGSRGTLAVALAACPNADQYAASPMISCCRAHSMGRSHRRAIPKPWGRCPSIAALTRSGARNDGTSPEGRGRVENSG